MAKELRKNKMMKIKTIKKAIAMFSLIAVSFATLGLSTTVVATDEGIGTGLKRGEGGADTPIVKAKWEMLGSYEQLSGADDRIAPGAQFDAPGVWDATMQYSICAIVDHREGLAPIDGVYTDIYYPIDRAFHPESPYSPDQINGGGGTILNPATPYDYGMNGCEKQRGDENRLYKLDKMVGYGLFCDNIKNNNTNLPSFYPNTLTPNPDDLFDYNDICASDGQLMKEKAYVYCADKELVWEDPAGNYKVEVFALSTFGRFSNLAVNHFEYLPLTSYEVDFSNVDYGTVLLNAEKTVSGNLVFEPSSSDKPTVRNTGNTRLNMGVEQNDMGMGTTDDVCNVSYRARVGNDEADWKFYRPYQHKWLEDVLDLSETEEMDFSITVTKFPNPDKDWVGTMTLDARATAFRQCESN